MGSCTPVATLARSLVPWNQPAAGADGNVGEADARGSGDAVEVVLFDGSAEGVEEAVLDVALELEGVLVVGALDRLDLEEVGIDEGCRARSRSGSRRER